MKGSLIVYCYHTHFKLSKIQMIHVRIFYLLGDIFFDKPEIRNNLNLMLRFVGLELMITQILYDYSWRSGSMKTIPMSMLFRVFAGIKSPKKLQLDKEDALKLMKM